jgi:type IV secretory pathway TraG/TraD family ATPase VirD4
MPPADLPDFHPMTVIRDWNNGEAFRIVNATSGVIAFGASGSGKTTAVAAHLAAGYLRQDFGGLVLCAKKEERILWENWALKADRYDDLVIVRPGGRHHFNPLDWEAGRQGEGGGFTINIVALLDEIGATLRGGKGEGGENRFFEEALHHLLTNLVELPVLAGYRLTLPMMRDILNSAPTALAEARDPEWHGSEDSVCASFLRAADQATRDAAPDVRAAFEESRTYWTVDFPGLHERTRGIITLMFSVLLRPFITPPLRSLFALDTTIEPEAAFDGKIIIVDLPVQEFRLAGRVANLIWKYCFQLAVMRREPPPLGKHARPIFLWADECQNFVSRFDAEYQAVARSAGGCTVYLTQNRESLRRVMGDNDAVDSLLGNLSTKFFCQNSSIDTNEFASQMLGERWTPIGSYSASRDASQHPGASQGSGSINVSEQRRRIVEPSEFTTLKRGGEQANREVQSIVYLGGHCFPDGNPFKRLTFRQG